MDIGIKFRAHACSPITGNKVVFKNAVNQAREPRWLKLQTQQASVKLGGGAASDQGGGKYMHPSSHCL